jgi:hypothetical protein
LRRGFRSLPRTRTRQLDGRVVHEHLRRLELLLRSPTGDRKENGVELLLRALLDPHLPALSSERHEIGAGKRNEIADELGRGSRRRRLDADRADWRLPSAAEPAG